MNSNATLATASAIATLWTLCLWGISRWLTQGVQAVLPRFFAAISSLFAMWVFSYAIAHNIPFLPAYFLFFSALVITIFTDATTLMISQYTTLYLMPIGWVLSSFGCLPLSALESICGSICGLLLLFTVRTLSHKFLGREGLGKGDIDLLCLIGAFTGPIGCWITLMAGSVIGSVIGIFYFIFSQTDRDFHLPFGLFLGIGAILYVLFKAPLTHLFLPLY